MSDTTTANTATATASAPADQQQGDPAAAAPPVEAAHSATRLSDTPTLTAAQANAIVQERLAEQKRSLEQQHQAAIAEAAERAGKSELDAARLDVEKYKAAADSAAQQARDEILQARIEAIVAGQEVRADRRDTVVKMLDRPDGLADLPPAEQRAAIVTAVAATLEAFPEWRAVGVPATAGGALPAPVNGVTVDAFRAMSVADRTELWRSAPDEYARLTAELKR